MPPRPTPDEPAIPFDPATEPQPGVVLPPGWTHETIVQPDSGTGHLEDRLARVTGAMSRIPKRGWNKDQKYAFVSQPDILDAVRPALAAERVRFRSELRSMRSEPDGRRTGGRADGMEWQMWTAEMDFTFSCRVDDTIEEDTVRWTGWAYDFGDKGGPKAETSALKTFLIQTFLISTGDDPDESPADQPAAQQVVSDQVASDLRSARNAALDWNQKLPKGKLSAIARKVAGNGVIMKIEDVALLQKIARAAARYEANPAGGEAWLTGEAPDDAQPDEPAENPGDPGEPPPPDDGEPESEGSPPEPEPEPDPLPPADSYDPPLTEDEARQHGLGIDPRPEGEGL
jgi:hypothetical protein